MKIDIVTEGHEIQGDHPRYTFMVDQAEIAGEDLGGEFPKQGLVRRSQFLASHPIP